MFFFSFFLLSLQSKKNSVGSEKLQGPEWQSGSLLAGSLAAQPIRLQSLLEDFSVHKKKEKKKIKTKLFFRPSPRRLTLCLSAL